MQKIILLITFFLIFIVNCQYFSLQSYKEWEDKNESTETVVYCAGSYTSTSVHAGYWENTKFHDVKNNSNVSQIFSIFVYEGDVYTAGYCSSRACYWKNDDEIYYLGNTGSYAWSIYVRSGIIYIAGFDVDGTTYKVGYWTTGLNGNIKQNVLLTTTTSTEGMNSAKHGEIYVDENFNIYMAGTIGSSSNPTTGFYYNSNKGLTYYDSGISEAHTLFVSSGTAYIGGAIGSSASARPACYWIEDKLIYTSSLMLYTTNDRGFSIFVSDKNNIYLTGWNYTNNYYVINKTDFNPNKDISSITVFNDIIYAGVYDSGAGYLKGNFNSSIIKLEVPAAATGNNTHAAKIFVTSRKK